MRHFKILPFIFILLASTAMAQTISGTLKGAVFTGDDGKTYDITGNVLLTPQQPTQPVTQPTTNPDVPPVVTTQPTTVPIITDSNQPTPDNTGPAKGTVFKDGSNLVPVAGQTYDGYNNIKKQSITMKAGQTMNFINCTFDAAQSIPAARYNIDASSNLGQLTITNCTMVGALSCAVYGDNFIATNNNVNHTAGDGFKPGSHCTVQHNYVTQLGWKSDGAHSDGVQLSGADNIVVKDNFFDMPLTDPNTHSNSSVFLQKPCSNIIIDHNWCRGGNFTMHVYPETGKNVSVTNNLFYTGSCKYGFLHTASTVTVKGNVYYETSKPCNPGDK